VDVTAPPSRLTALHKSSIVRLGPAGLAFIIGRTRRGDADKGDEMKVRSDCSPTSPRPDDERGATAVEYAIILSGIAAVVIGTVALLGLSVFACFDAITGTF
jgi:pilus assembly protein Flp/PilA